MEWIPRPFPAAPSAPVSFSGRTATWLAEKGTDVQREDHRG